MDANYEPYKRFDDEFKRSAVDLLETSGRPMAEVAGDLEIPYKTLERWRNLYRNRSGSPEEPGLHSFRNFSRPTMETQHQTLNLI